MHTLSCYVFFTLLFTCSESFGTSKRKAQKQLNMPSNQAAPEGGVKKPSSSQKKHREQNPKVKIPKYNKFGQLVTLRNIQKPNTTSH